MGKPRRHAVGHRLSGWRTALGLAATSLLASACISGPIAGPAQSSTLPPTSAAPSASQVVEPVEPGAGESSDTRAAEVSATVSPSATPARTASPSPTPSPTSVRNSPAPVSPPFAGFFAPGAVVKGPGEYRVGTTNWYIQVPAGMSLRWDFVLNPDADGEVRWGWSDVDSGSQMLVTARDVTDASRVLTGSSTDRAKADRNFDAVIASVSRQTTE